MILFCLFLEMYNFVRKLCCKELGGAFVANRSILVFIYNLLRGVLLVFEGNAFIALGESALIGQEVPECAPDEHIQHMYHPQNHSIV
jgi:hypothetical protein